ncbi:hypothetical protein pb186bvf_009932 [Paramecium bursaria]
MDEGYFFQCGICNKFPKLPIECIHCNKWYCYNCKNFLHSNEIRGCNCQFEDLYILEPFQQYVYNRLTIKCQICQVLLPLNQSKKHQIKCEYQQTNQELFNDKQYQKYEPKIMKYCKNLKYQKCKIFKLLLSDLQLSNLSEDTIIELQSIIFQCKLCLEEGNLFIMRQHHFFCRQVIVNCICGLNYKRELLNDHILQCLKEQVIINQNHYQQVSYALNSQQIAFFQQLRQNLHDFQRIFYTKEFQFYDQNYETKHTL